MMDSIRRQQIAEVLNYDRNMNLQVISLEKKGVAKMAEPGGLSSLQTQYVIDDATELINSLMVILDGQETSSRLVSATFHPCTRKATY